jgi:hypothetical protein
MMDANDEDHGAEETRSVRRSCAEVVSLAPTASSQSESGALSKVGSDRAVPEARVLVIDTRVEGFFLQRFDDRGGLVGETQHYIRGDGDVAG